METAGAGSGVDIVLDGSPVVRLCGCEAAEGVKVKGGSGGGISATSPGGGLQVREILR